ncbi:tubulin/FtsZ family protein [Methanofollis fontis]|uniref:Cell division protein n=1 Tax=Methanofollis fontis TaxID=2052832 RepID=A0A483CUI9_9EURY|nr:tubulin/FtsZ family protein [Methanofollis fontis]TAJ45276.1 cell division protein [Methanofollis fontis]
MRVLAIGLGGAGSRIVDRLYDHDRRSKILCMNALTIDLDSNSLIQLERLPEESKVFFPPIDPAHPFDVKTTIDIEEVMTRIQKVDTVEIDAIMICAGLGGTMVNAVPFIVPELRKSFIEPIFAVVTLPCNGEGKRRAAKAADDFEMVEALVDSTIVFDNDTWYRKLRLKETSGPVREKGGRRDPGLTYSSNPKKVNTVLNEHIARRIGLLLRAGEFSDNGLEVGELVLDAGEVLNTLNGMGTVAVGYAVERLPSGTFDFLTKWNSARRFMEGSQTRAARIVSLAKKAVYEEISVPCDLTSAQKALVLIAGPSYELSIKGFVTVRKWIDRSIAGLEVRSGDYPVKSTNYVGIIIVLSGVENIPRIEELKILREQYLLECEDREDAGDVEGEDVTAGDHPSYDPLAPPEPEDEGEHDEMISIEGAKQQGTEKNEGSGVMRLHLSSDSLKRRVEEGDAIIVPGVKSEAPRDITRKTSIGGPQAPKDASLGTGSSWGMMKKPKEADFTHIKVDNLPETRDDLLSDRAISMKSTVKKAKDDIFTGESVRMRDGSVAPADDVLVGPSRIAPKQQPKEVEPGKRKISVSEGDTKKKKGDSEHIDWIT